jgi:hypothetical protein
MSGRWGSEDGVLAPEAPGDGEAFVVVATLDFIPNQS